MLSCHMNQPRRSLCRSGRSPSCRRRRRRRPRSPEQEPKQELLSKPELLSPRLPKGSVDVALSPSTWGPMPPSCLTRAAARCPAGRSAVRRDRAGVGAGAGAEAGAAVGAGAAVALLAAGLRRCDVAALDLPMPPPRLTHAEARCPAGRSGGASCRAPARSRSSSRCARCRVRGPRIPTPCLSCARGALQRTMPLRPLASRCEGASLPARPLPRAPALAANVGGSRAPLHKKKRKLLGGPRGSAPSPARALERRLAQLRTYRVRACARSSSSGASLAPSRVVTVDSRAEGTKTLRAALVSRLTKPAAGVRRPRPTKDCERLGPEMNPSLTTNQHRSRPLLS